MRLAPGAAVIVLVAVACGSPAPTTIQQPTPTPSPAVTLAPLPENLSGIPTDEEFTAEISAHTPSGELVMAVPLNYRLGHCGLISPIDIDGSLWDPVGGRTSAGEPLTGDPLGELINATQTVVVLVAPDTMELQTPSGNVVVLTRHDGPRRYFLCD
jgi:hypothetical protein